MSNRFTTSSAEKGKFEQFNNMNKEFLLNRADKKEILSDAEKRILELENQYEEEIKKGNNRDEEKIYKILSAQKNLYGLIERENNRKNYKKDKNR